MATGIGVQGGYINTGEEVVYGTAVARTVPLFHNSESIRAVENKNFSGAIYKVARLAVRQVQGNIGVNGDISWNPSHAHRSWTRFLYHALGTCVTTHPDPTGAPTVYQHTFTPADLLPTGLTLEIGKDVTATLFSGCKLTSLKMSGAAGGLLDASVSVIGKDGIATTSSVPSITESEIIVVTATTITWGGTEIDVMNFDINIDNALTTRYFTSARTTKEPLRNAKRRISGSFRVELRDDTIWDDFRDATNRELIITCVGGTIGGGFSYETKITVPIAQVLEGNANADTEGILQIPCSFDGFIDDVDTDEIIVRVTNLNTSY